MKISPLPTTEKERLEALHSYQILDSENEPDFDGIVDLASQICNVPIALITLIDEDRQWFKAKIGLSLNETHRDVAFCAHTIHEDDIMVVRDAIKDERFHDNPFVKKAPKIRFYAGMPLITNSGHKLGILCVIDKKPRVLNKKQLNDLRILGRQVINLLDLRLRNLELKNQVQQKSAELQKIIENLEGAEEQANLGSWYVEVGSGKRHWSKQMFRIFGLDPLSEIPGFEDNLKRYHPDDRSTIKAGFEKMQGGEEPEPIILRTNPALLPLLHLLPTWRVIKDKAGKPVRFEGTLLDITERIKAEEALRQSEANYRELIEGNPQPMWIYGRDSLQILDVNQAAVAKYGYGRDEFLQLTIKDLHPAEEVDMLDKLLKGVLLHKQGLLQTGPWKHRLKNGALIDVEITSQDIFWNGRNARFVMAWDLTQRMQMEASLRTAEELYRNIFKNSLDGIFQSTPDGKVMAVNPAAAKMFGYSSTNEFMASITDRGTQLYADPKDRDNLRDLLLKEGKAMGYEFRGLKKDKEVIWARTNIQVVYDDEGKIKYFKGTVRDITKEKIAEAQLLKEKELSDSIIKSLPGVFYLYDQTGKFLRWNKNLETVSGYSANEIANMAAGEFFEEDEDRDLFLGKVGEVFMKGHGEVELNFLLKDKSKIPYYLNGWKIEYENQTCLIGVGIDISARKAAEAAGQLSEANYRSIFDNALIGIYQSTHDGRFIMANPAMANMFGYSSAEELITSITNIGTQIYADQTERVRLKNLIREDGLALGYEFKAFKKNGEIIWVRDNVQAVYGDDGRIKYFEGSVKEITGQKAAEEKLRNSENKLRAFFRSTPDSSVLLGKNFEILAFNDAGAELNASTYGNELHEGDIFIDKIFPEVRPIIKAFVENAFKGETSQGEFPIPNIKTGHRVWWLAVFMPAYDSDGNIFAVVGNSTNIDKLKRAEFKLTKQFEELKKTNSELDRFVYSVSHDLRAPLASILGLVNVAEMESPPPVFGNYFTMIHTSVTKLDIFINSILDYSRNARMELTTGRIDFQVLITEIQNNFRMIPGAERLKTELTIDSTIEFHSDHTRLGILMNNLLSNAIRYQDYHKETSHVRVQIVQSASNVWIKFSDNGIGIEAKHLGKIFDMFYRASENSKGSGLGLYIVKETVDKLGGTIKVESVVGVGTAFEIVIPNSPA